MPKYTYFFSFLLLMLLNIVVRAQDSVAKFSDAAVAQGAGQGNKIEMADVLYQNGKIYLVVLVLLTIFGGIVFYLFRLEKRLHKLENQSNIKS